MRRPRSLSVLLVALIAAGLGAAAEPSRESASAPTSANPTVWRLTDAQRVAGLTTTVLGSPQVKSVTATASPSAQLDADAQAALYFNGVDEGIFLPVNPLAGLPAFTIEVLFKPASDGPAEQRFFHLQDKPGSRALLEIRLADGRWALDTFLYSVESGEKCALLDRSKTHPANEWTWVALVYADGRMTHYINGEKELAGTVKFPPTLAAGQVSLGVRQNKVYWFKGGLREVRFHRAALAPGALQSAASTP